MRLTVGRLLLPLTLIVGLALACNWSTANIKDVKMSKDQDGKEEMSKVGPGETIYAVSSVANNPGTVKVKWRVLYDDVKGKKSGDVASFLDGADGKSMDIDKDRSIYLSLKFPSSGAANGKYKVELTMLNDKNELKETKTATFEVAGYSEGDGD